MTQDRGDMVAGSLRCSPTARPQPIGAAALRDDTRLSAIRLASRLAVADARPATLMRLFLGNSTTSPRSGVTSRTAPTTTVPRRSEQPLLLTIRSANHPGNGSALVPPQARQRDRRLPSRFTLPSRMRSRPSQATQRLAWTCSPAQPRSGPRATWHPCPEAALRVGDWAWQRCPRRWPGEAAQGKRQHRRARPRAYATSRLVTSNAAMIASGCRPLQQGRRGGLLAEAPSAIPEPGLMASA